MTCYLLTGFIFGFGFTIGVACGFTAICHTIDIVKSILDHFHVKAMLKELGKNK